MGASTFISRVLGAPAPQQRILAIIFNMWDYGGHLGPEDARAFLRHATQALYANFTRIDTEGIPFCSETTFLRALKSFRAAVHRYGEGIKRFRARREHTNQKQHISDLDLKRYPGVITIDTETYKFNLTGAFDSALQHAQRNVDKLYEHTFAAPTQPAAPPPGAPGAT